MTPFVAANRHRVGQHRGARRRHKRGFQHWPEVAWAGLDRLRQDAQRSPFGQELHSLISLAEAALDGVSRPSPAEGGFMVCPWFRIGGTVVRTIAMTARFDHIAEVTLDELRIELMYPLDDDAERFFRAHHSQARLSPRAAGPGAQGR